MSYARIANYLQTVLFRPLSIGGAAAPSALTFLRPCSLSVKVVPALIMHYFKH